MPRAQNLFRSTTLAQNYSGKHGSGICNGLSTLWLYTKWRQFTEDLAQVEIIPSAQDQFQVVIQPTPPSCKYNNDWFSKTVHTITTWDKQRDFTLEEHDDAVVFGTLVDFFQDGLVTTHTCRIPQRDIASKMVMSRLDTRGKTLKKRYAIASEFDLEQLQKLIKEIVHDDELVYVLASGHTTGLFKHGKYYYYYNPDNDGGEYATTSVEQIAETILAEIYQLDSPYNDHRIGFVIFSFDQSIHPYKEHKNFLKRSSDPATLFSQAHHAIHVGSLESLQFYLDQGLDPNLIDPEGNNRTLLMAAIVYNYPDCAIELLRRRADPYQSSIYPDPSGESGEKHRTPFDAATSFGYEEVIKALSPYRRQSATTASIASQESEHKENH